MGAPAGAAGAAFVPIDPDYPAARRAFMLTDSGELDEALQFVAERGVKGEAQSVYAALGDRMREEVHALSMTTLTPLQWRATR